MNAETFYNPETNHIKSVKAWSNLEQYNRGYINLGYKKVAEAFTSVSPEERPILWKSLNEGETYSFDFSMLNSKIRHKLKRLGLEPWRKHHLMGGKKLLQKINSKKLN